MRPKQQPKARHDDLFRARLDQIINMRHELVVLADKVDWAWLDAELAENFSDQGRPAEPVRFMIGMFMLKHTYGLSDEQVWDRWVQDPYFQYFTGEEFFQHVLPHERSGMSHWRKRIGDRLDILLQESLRIAHDTGALGGGRTGTRTPDPLIKRLRSIVRSQGLRSKLSGNMGVMSQ
jgi:IS5 family transposase